MSFVNPLDAFPEPDIKGLLLKHYKGKAWNELASPALIVKQSIVDNNCTNMLKRIEAMGTKFRAHVKTHKTIEGTKRQLGYLLPNYDGLKYDAIVVSTLKEAWEIVNYQEKTGDVFVRDITYGLPNITMETLPQLSALSQKIDRLGLLCDDLQQLEFIKEYSKKNGIVKPWSLTVKLDIGTSRAGIWETSYLKEFLNEIFSTDSVELYGFYVHSGHSYKCDSFEEAEEALIEELEGVRNGLNVLAESFPEIDSSALVVSVGATPTLHSLEHHVFQKSNDRVAKIASELKGQLEFHAGNFLFCDQQQISTGCVTLANVALSVVGTVVSSYPKRNNTVGELLTNTGVIVMSREVSRKFPGFGNVIVDSQYGQWYLDRMSQEHGILTPVEGETNAKLIPAGTKVKVVPNHACITVLAFNAYYILDDDGVVIDVWIPWKGW